MGVTAATNGGFPGFRSGKCVRLLLCQLIPTQLVYGIRRTQLQMLLGMNEKDPKNRLEHWALIRHSAVSWIEQCLSQGNTLGRALALASELD